MSASITHVLAPVDQSAPSTRAAGIALGIARGVGASLTLLHVHIRESAIRESITIRPQDLTDISDTQLESILIELLGNPSEASLQLAAKHSAVEFEKSEHSPADVTLEYAKSHGVDLIVLGAHGRSKLHDVLMGSVAKRILERAPCPVTVVR